MAYTSCSSVLNGNIAMDCDSPIVGGYTGLGVIVRMGANPTITRDAANPRKITNITSAKGGVFVINNAFVTPFTGSNTAGNTDNGFGVYRKTVSMQIPLRGGDVSKDIIEPLVDDPEGYLIILQKRDRVGDGSFEVIGSISGARGDVSTLTRDENANGGMWSVSMVCDESYAEVALVGADGTYESAKTVFDNLIASTTIGVLSLSGSEKKSNITSSLT